METLKLRGSARGKGNKGVSRRIREAGEIPAVCYGKGLESISFTVSPTELMKGLSGEYGPNVLIDLSVEVEGKDVTRTVMVKSLQRDPVTRRVLHADFYALDMDRKVLVEVPIRLVGKAVGVGLGGRLRQVTRSVNVRCLPKDIPVDVAYDVSALDIKQRAQVSQIVPPAGLELVYHTDFAIAQILAPSKSGN